MKARFRIYFDNLSAYVYSGTDLYIEFRDCEDILYSAVNVFDNISIDIQSNLKQVDQWNNAGGASYTSNFESLSDNGSYIEFVANLNNFSSFESFVSAGIVEIYPLANETLLYLYTQNSENNALNKSLTLVNIIAGKFNHSIGVKSLNIDVVNINMNFNYVYIPSLNRYYYVDSIEIISNDVRRLHLKEDVLSSWNLLIRSQSAFIVRRENGSNRSVLKDDRLPLEDKVSHQYFKNLTMGALKNITLDYSNNTWNRFLISTISNIESLTNGETNPPSNSGLPTIATHVSTHDCIRFGSHVIVSRFINGIFNDDAVNSFVNSVLWLPFDPISVFGAINNLPIRAGDKYLNSVGIFVDNSSTQSATTCYGVQQNNDSPYLVVADFTFNQAGGVDVTDSMLMRESYWDIFIPFVGWVNIDFAKVYNKRILIYYTMDLKTGISTAYIYNYTDKIVIYSTTCTLGIQIDLTTTNRLENTRQKQANDLNMLMSTMTSIFSIGLGIATENPIATVGGVLSMGKAITGYVNANNQIYERANTSFGTSDGAVHSPLYICIRRSYHAPIFIDADTYGHMQGYPTNEYVSDLEDIYGYVEVGEIHFNPFNEVIYQDEINEIVTLLKDGVIF